MQRIRREKEKKGAERETGKKKFPGQEIILWLTSQLQAWKEQPVIGTYLPNYHRRSRSHNCSDFLLGYYTCIRQWFTLYLIPVRKVSVKANQLKGNRKSAHSIHCVKTERRANAASATKRYRYPREGARIVK